MPEVGFDGANSLFIRRWGEMAASWGISRTMAEIHALLYVATRPLCTDDVMEGLAVSRGSASTNIRELVNWGLIHRVHRRGDRKEYFEAEHDVWQMFETIVRERRRREIQPIVETIQRCLTMIEEETRGLRGQTRKEAETHKQRFAEILDFCEMITGLFDLVSTAGRYGLKPLSRTIAKLVK